MSAWIHIAQQMINLKPYVKGSFLFDKVGELVGIYWYNILSISLKVELDGY